jgi:hypothetical protein
VYLYVQTTVPSQVIGLGAEVDPINAGVNILPQASVIFAGAPGSTASTGQVTVVEPKGGGVRPVLKLMVYVNVQSTVLLSHAV